MRLPTAEVLKALAVTAELCGTTLSDAAARIFASDLAAYSETQVLAALLKCRRELKGKLTPAEVIARIPVYSAAHQPMLALPQIFTSADLAPKFAEMRQSFEKLEKPAASCAWAEKALARHEAGENLLTVEALQLVKATLRHAS